MNIWNLKRVNQIFEASTPKLQPQKKETQLGFSFFNPNQNNLNPDNIQSSMKVNEQKGQKSIEETLSFKEACKIKSKALVKDGQKQIEQEDESWIEKPMKLVQKGKKMQRLRNLKSIAFIVFQHLRRFNYASYSQLSLELYSDASEFEDKQQTKNIRRRLYDAVNVMISANVLVKNKHLIQYNEQSGVRTIYDAKEEIKCLKYQVKEKEKEIQWKSNYLKHLNSIYSVLGQFYRRNQQIYDPKTEQRKLQLPIIASRCEAVEVRQMEQENIEMMSMSKKIEVETEMQLLARLFPSSESQYLLKGEE